MIDPNKDECASCGQTRDKHGRHKPPYCPRFVKPPDFTEARDKAREEARAAARKTLEQLYKDLLSPGFTFLPGKAWFHGVPVSSQVQDTKDPFEPVYHRASAGKIDYTQWVDEADCLTDDTRGGMRPPPPKGKIIF